MERRLQLERFGALCGDKWLEAVNGKAGLV